MTDDLSQPGTASIDHQRGDAASAERDRVEPAGLFPRQPAADQSKGRLAFILVLICYAIIDFERLHWVPLGPDTGLNWELFYASYIELIFHNDLAHWFPYGAYGQPNTLHNLMGLSATDYLMMTIGKLFHINNAVVLFQLSLLADHVLFLLGIHLLSRSLFRRQSTVWLCLIGSITLLYGFQLTFIQVFRMVGWYPLVLYFLVRFFRDQRAEGLWMAGTVFTFSCLGMAYEQPWPFMALLPFIAVATWKHPGAWRDVVRCRAGILVTMILFAAAASLYLYLALHVLDGVETIREGRTGSSGVVDLETFSSDKTRIFTLYDVVLSFVCGHVFYIGLLPLGCVLWGLLRVRTPLFAAFMVSSLFFVWFPLGGVLALALYYSVPFISLLHYIYMSFHFLPVALLLAAGAAWDQLELSWKNLKIWLTFPVIIIFAIDFSFYGCSLALTPKYAQSLVNLTWIALAKVGVYGGLVGLAAVLSLVLRSAAQGSSQRWRVCMSFRGLVTAALLTGLFVDVFRYSYQSGTPANRIGTNFDAPYSNWQPVKKSSPVYRTGYIHPLTWQGERLDQTNDERQQFALQTPAYFYVYAFAQFDPCRRKREWNLEWHSVGIAMQKLLALREENDQALQTILGCYAPKLRLLTQALYVTNEAEAAAAVRNHGDLVNVAILQLPANLPPPPMPRSSPAGSPGSVHVTDFGANAIQIYVNVTNPGGAWLVYADTYDPRWQAWVNGKPAPVVPAYVGLKAVWVPQGESVVRMKFSAGSNVGVRVLAIGGAICSLSLLLFCGVCCVQGFPSSQRKVSETLSTRTDESTEPICT